MNYYVTNDLLSYTREKRTFKEIYYYFGLKEEKMLKLSIVHTVSQL